jgi:hypothetical protein
MKLYSEEQINLFFKNFDHLPIGKTNPSSRPFAEESISWMEYFVSKTKPYIWGKLRHLLKCFSNITKSENISNRSGVILFT